MADELYAGQSRYNALLASFNADHVDGHQWEGGGEAEGEPLAECRRCGWITHAFAVRADSRSRQMLRLASRAVSSSGSDPKKEWADIPTCDDAMVRIILEG